MSNTLCIIPAAGLGTRMGMKPNESKEMLIDPCTHEPIIKWGLDLCRKHHIEPLVVTRKEKVDLIDYLAQQGVNTLIIEPSGEWPDTVLASQHLWKENNILLLPDTRFSPENSLKWVEESLILNKGSVFALHKVEDMSKWGGVSASGYTEKPANNTPGYAWGLIGFQDKFGVRIFKDMSIPNKLNFHVASNNFLFLDKFVDLTRSGKIEKWK